LKRALKPSLAAVVVNVVVHVEDDAAMKPPGPKEASIIGTIVHM
jgi:hypothetical protein